MALIFLLLTLTVLTFSPASDARMMTGLFDASSSSAPKAQASAAFVSANPQALRTAVLKPATSAAASAALVTTDKTDYLPGETVIISGSGWEAGETVSLVLHEEPAKHPDKTLSAVADEYGNILNREYSPTQENVGTSYTLTATGQRSGRTATAQFTDGGSMNYSPNNQILNIQTDASAQSASFMQTVSAPRGNGTFTASLLVTATGTNPLPAAWVSASPNPLSYATGTGTPTVFFPQTRTVTVTVPPFTPAGTYTAQIRVNPSITGVGQGAGTNLSVVVTADNAPPNTMLSATTPPSNPYNGFDWTNQDVTVTLSATDSGTPTTGVASTKYKLNSGPYVNYSGPFTISSEGITVITYLSTDNQGNNEPGQTFTVKIDKTAPTLNCGSADGSWHATDVTIPCTASDSSAGLTDAADASFSLSTNVPGSTEDANAATDSRNVCDTAGNCATAGPIGGNMIDKNAPTLNCGNADGSWHATDVTIPCTSSDGGSGLASAGDASFNLATNVPASTEDANVSTDSRNVCDAVGNCSTAGPISSNMIDKKAPSTSCVNADGSWHATDVTIPCTASDGGSGLASAGDASFGLSTSVAANMEDANAATDSRNVCDTAGNCATAGPIGGNMIDKKAPSISCDSPDGLWHGSDVGLTCTASDGGSGVAGSNTAVLSTSVPAGVETSNASTGSHVFTDAVGNSSTAGPIGGNRIDKKAPSVACGSADGSWHATNVSIPCTSSDGGSGLTNAGDASFSLSTSVPAGTETSNALTDSRNVADAVGNSSTAGPIGGNMIDRKGPTITITTPVAGGNYTLNQVVASAYSVSDAGSGVASSNPASGGSLDTATVGGKSFAVNATDNVGNSSSQSAGYNVTYALVGICPLGPGRTILQPINPDGTSVFKQGSTVPAKFRVYDANCVSVGTPGVVSDFRLVQVIAGVVVDAVNEPVISTAADPAYRWDAADRQWIFNINTKSLSANKTYVFQISLNDGTAMLFRFGLK